MQAWILLSTSLTRLTRFSCSRYASYRASMLSTIGFHLQGDVNGQLSVKSDTACTRRLTQKPKTDGRYSRVVVVDKVSEPGCVDNVETEADSVLLNVWRGGARPDQSGGARARRGTSERMVGGVLEGGAKVSSRYLFTD